MSRTGPAWDLEVLLRSLRAERRPSGKLRLLARSWQLLQRLDRDERERVALGVGSNWIWKRLERFLRADGQLRPWERGIQRALERMGSADPAELRELAASLRSRDRRGLQDLLAGTLREVLEEEALLVEHARSQVELVEPGSDPKEEGSIEEGPSTSPEVAIPSEPPSVSDPEAVAVPPVSVPPASPPAPLPAATARPRLPDPAPVFSPPRPAPPPAPEAPPAAVAPLSVAPAASTRERLAQLRALRAAPASARALGAEGRAALVRGFGPGWAARRALSWLLANECVPDLDEALSLIGRLASPMQRTWCLGDLVAHWELDEAEASRVLEAAPSSSARRRLERRLRAPRREAGAA